MKLSSPILIFTLVSTSIHAAIFLVTDPIQLTLPGSTGSVMSIQLESGIKPSIQKSQSRINKTKNTVTDIEDQPELASTFRTLTSGLHSVKQEISSIPSIKNQSKILPVTNKNNAISKAHVISVIYKQFSNYFIYPTIAQKRNWQGKVIIEFKINTEGTIENIQINKSSGFNILDQATIDSLKRIGQLPQLATWLNTRMDIQIPVIYKLTEG